MSSSIAEVIMPLIGKYYKPRTELRLTSQEVLYPKPHFAKIRGPITIFGKITQSLIQIDLIYKENDYWNSVKKNVSFEKLGLYDKVEEKDLPWNNSEQWYSQSPYAHITPQDIEAIICSRETRTKHL